LSSTDPSLRGFWQPQSLWSSPITADLDGDGRLEVITGTGNYFQDTRGSYIEVRHADGSLAFDLPTQGRTFATPLVADLDGDGRPEIVAATLDGYVYGWNWQGTQLFATHVQSYGVAASTNLSITAAPIAVDMTGDGRLEIILTTNGPQLAVLDASGVQINNTALLQNIYQTSAGSPAVRDIDRDGSLELISGGTNVAHDQAVVYRWENPFATTSSVYRDGRYQFHQSLSNIDNFVERFYVEILGRASDAGGSNYWDDALYTGIKSGADVAQGFIFSTEFTNRNLADTAYVDTLYRAFFNRQADAGGRSAWLSQIAAGASRAAVLDGFIYSAEFSNLSSSYGIRPAAIAAPNSGPGNDLLMGTSGADIMRGGLGNDTIIADGTSMPGATFDANEVHNGQVYRLYGATLGRQPDAGGFGGWVSGLDTNITVSQAAGAFVDSAEFQATYGPLNNSGFVTLLYQNVLHRAPDAGGLASWVGSLNGGATRASVVLGFSESAEYRNNTDSAFHTYMREALPAWNDVIEGGAGNDVVSGGHGSDTYIFRQGAGGIDDVYGFESWDQLQLSGFGYANAAAALAHMTQSGSNVVFSDQGETITFRGATLAEMAKVKYNVS
jgi:Domain of unknown function (DUF4214)/FG-GAP-like repeat/RTX calcium-binding nonapeptide repeat (4 copies)